MTTYVLDTETTGREPPEVIELAYAAVKETVWAVYSKDVIVERFRPKEPSLYGALSVHHILPEDLEGCPPSSAAKLPQDCTYVIGHNIDYDAEALRLPRSIRRICTLAIARKLHPEMDSHRLGAMTYRYAESFHEAKQMCKGAHAAEDDLYMLLLVLGGMLRAVNKFDCTVEELWKFSESCRVPSVMGFGKYKGVPIAKVPKDYVRWYARQDDTDPYLLEAFRQARLL